MINTDKMVLQINSNLNQKINLFGCNFRSLLAISEFVNDKYLTAEQILTAYEDLVGKAMDDECTVKVLEGEQYAHPEMIINYGFKALNDKHHEGYQIGQIEKDLVFKYWAGGSPDKIDFCVLEGETHRGNTHFRLANKEGKLIFDPYGSLPVIQELSVIFYRVVEV